MKHTLILISAFLLAPLHAAEPVRPNVIVMIADDLGYGDVSCLSHGQVKTPNIDRLAQMGIKFTSGYVSAPLCAPSRAGFFTGLYQQRFGFNNNDSVTGIPADLPLLPGVLRAAGYHTGLLGKWHSEAFLTGAKSTSPHEALFFSVTGSGAVRQNQWKLVLAPNGKAQLFDLANDLEETHDLSSTETARFNAGSACSHS